jgi:hypothetical protein
MGHASAFEVAFGPEALAFEQDCLGVVQKPVEQRGGERAVVVEIRQL